MARRRCMGGVACLFLGLLPLRSAESPVSAELIVPPATTHVIGDHTPLIWRFHNHGSEPLAFMWEGCCRLNGRLTVTAEDRWIAPVPPGQALAHMFARAERLDPGEPADFETRLSDWVQLRDSGDYQLEGRYTGVLPEQTPQVPRGLKLWREAAVTPPLEVRLLSVEDYLMERGARAARRGLRLDLSGPAKLPPLQPSPFSLVLLNSSSREQRVVWPTDFQLWIVDATGRRLGNVPTSVEGPHQELALSPGQRVDLAVPFDSGLIEGAALGSYRVFVDLSAGDTGEPRLPSNPVALRWELGSAEVEHLLQLAAGGSRVGLRNAPLKLLRVYLGEIGAALAAVEPADATPALLALRDQLRLASCLKAYAPIPGRVELSLEIATDGVPRLAEPGIANCVAGNRLEAGAGEIARLKQVLAVRRHLGWEVGLSVRPDPETTVGTLFHTLEPFFDPGMDLAGPPRALVSGQATNLPVVVFRPGPLPAEFLVRLRKGTSDVTTAVAVKPVTATGSSPERFKADEISMAAYTGVSDLASITQTLGPGVQTMVLADPGLTWSELLKAVQPLVERRVAFDVCLDR